MASLFMAYLWGQKHTEPALAVYYPACSQARESPDLTTRWGVIESGLSYAVCSVIVESNLLSLSSGNQ